MKIVVSPDSFKGTMSAFEAAGAMRRGLLHSFPDAEIVMLPVGDGGEGTLEAIAASLPDMVRVSVDTVDPLRRPIRTSYYISEEKTAFIESAAASGLTLLHPHERDIFKADTYGTGLLIADAFRRGIRRFVVCMGGTATCDGGYGAFLALGTLDLSDCEFNLLCDVTNPLCGHRGAAAVFGPQKGAGPGDIPLLDEMLREKGAFYESLRGVNVADAPFAGAAGGLAAMLMACFGAIPKRGIEEVLRLIRFRERIEGADLIITGEGRADATTLSGKAPSGILEEAVKAGVPVVLICGKIVDADALRRAGFADAIQATPDHPDPAVSPADYLAMAVKRALPRPSPLNSDQGKERGTPGLTE